MTIIEERADSRKFVYAYCKSHAPLAAQTTVGGKLQIYGPPGIPPTWKTRALEFLRMNVLVPEDIPTEQASYQFRCYGDTLQECDKVWFTLRPLLHRVNAVQVQSGTQKLILQHSRILSVDENFEGPPLNWYYILVMTEMRWGTVLH